MSLSLSAFFMHMSLALPFMLMHASLSVAYFALTCSLVIIPIVSDVVDVPELILELLGVVGIDVWLSAENPIVHKPNMSVLKCGLKAFI